MNKRLRNSSEIKWINEQLYHRKILCNVTIINDYFFNKNIVRKNILA